MDSKFTIIPCPVTEALVSAFAPDIMDMDFGKEMLDRISRLDEAEEGVDEILLSPLSLNNHLYQLWLAATTLKLYAKKHGRFTLPGPVMDGMQRTWEGIWDIFWGTAQAAFPKIEGMSIARVGLEPCLIVTRETPARVSKRRSMGKVTVFAIGGGPEQQEMAQHIQDAINQEMSGE